jgi:hypothetical protein
MWKIPIALVLIGVIVLGLFNVGLITIAGAGAPRVRYQSEDVSFPGEPLQWSFDDVAEGGLPDRSEVLSETRFGGWGMRAESDTASAPDALCQTGMGEFPAIALGDAVLGDLVMSTQFKPISGRVDQAAGVIFRV